MRRQSKNLKRCQKSCGRGQVPGSPQLRGAPRRRPESGTRTQALPFRINCSLARCEYQINRLLNVDNFLSHEIDFWKSRRRWFRQWKWLLVVAGLTAFVLQWVLMHTYMPGSKFCDERGLRWPLYAISLLLPVLVTINFARTWKLLSQGRPEEIPHGANPLSPKLKPEVPE